jgi:hypothetical protein
MLSEFWRGVMQEIVAGLTVAALCAFVAWLWKSYSRFRSMDRSLAAIAEQLPGLNNTMRDHGRRIDRLETRTGIAKPDEPASQPGTSPPA